MFAPLTIAASLVLRPPLQRPDDRMAISWDAPSECPDGRELLDRIESFAPGVSTRAPTASLRGTVERSATGYAVALTLRSPATATIHRRFESLECDVLVSAAALLVAVFLDPVASAQTVQARPIAKPESESEPELLPNPAPEPDPEPDPDPRLLTRATVSERGGERRASAVRAALRLHAGGGYGPTNTGAATLGGGIALLGPRWRTQLDASWVVPRVIRVQANVGGVFDAWFVAARGCFVPAVGARERIELPVCGGGELGQVRGRGVDELPVASQASLVWLALALGQGLWFGPIDRLAIGLDVQLAVPLQRGSFSVETVEIQRLAPVSVRGLVGVELRLP